MAQWQIVFFIAAFVYIICATFYNMFGSGVRQAWDNPLLDDASATPMHNGVNGNLNGQQQRNGGNGVVVNETRH